MKKLLLLILALCFGCTTMNDRRDQYEKVLNSYRGAPSQALISNFGIPSNEYSYNGKKLIEYSRNGGAVAMPVGSMAFANNLYCKTTFTINEIDMVEGYRYEGNWCY